MQLIVFHIKKVQMIWIVSQSLSAFNSSSMTSLVVSLQWAMIHLWKLINQIFFKNTLISLDECWS